MLREERSKEREPASKKVEPEKIINTPFLNRASLSELTALHRTGKVALGIDRTAWSEPTNSTVPTLWVLSTSSDIVLQPSGGSAVNGTFAEARTSLKKRPIHSHNSEG